MSFVIPDDFRSFMKSVVVYLETPTPDLELDGEHALDADCGYGGRIDGVDTFQFKYISRDGKHRWDVILKEAQIRDIADGLLIEVDAEPFELQRTTRRAPVGKPLIVWGDGPTDALQIEGELELMAALDALHGLSLERAVLVRVWTSADDQVVAVLWGDRCALYVVDSPEGYATSMGDQTRTSSLVVADHDGLEITVPTSDCVSWDYARRALVRFVEHSDLGDVPVEGRIPSQLLIHGDVDRKAALAARPAIASDPMRTSLQRAMTDESEETLEFPIPDLDKPR